MAKLAFGESAFRHLLTRYKFNAKNSNVEWNLDTETFRGLTKSNCAYCGKVPSQICKGSVPAKVNGSYTYNGVDRLDSSRGYTPENVVSCCGVCNIMKNTKTVDEFISACRAVVQHLNKN